MADVPSERGRIYRWPRNRAFGDSKPRPVLVISPDAANRHSQRWVVVPLSSDPRLSGVALAVTLSPTPNNGLDTTSYAMSWLPTTVDRTQLDGPIGRVEQAELRLVLNTLSAALDLEMVEPWTSQPEPHSR
jgi:mRNA-degrading endonuclease toxin of MazEF toxin-antitoxin module